MTKLRKIFKRSWLIIFILLSLGAIKVLYDLSLTPTYFSVNQETTRILAQNQKKAEPVIKATEIKNADYDDLTDARVNFTKTVNDSLIAVLQIKKAGILLPILSYASNQTLSTGAAQYFTDRKPGTGNYVLASHNFDGADVLLARISQLEKGDQVRVLNGTKVFTYRVTINKVIHETQTEYLDQTKGAQLTLIRCEGGENTVRRRVVVATLTNTVTVAAPASSSQPKLSTTSIVQDAKIGGYSSFLSRLSKNAAVVNAAEILALWLSGKQIILLVEVAVIWMIIAYLLIRFGSWV